MKSIQRVLVTLCLGAMAVSFSPGEAVDRLRAAGGQVLRDSPAFRSFLEALSRAH
jgi:hypothetical protein